MIIFIPMKRFLLMGVLCLLAVSARAGALEDIVPRPADAMLTKGSLRISGKPFKCDPAFGEQTRGAVRDFASHLGYVSGKTCPFSSPPGLNQAVASNKVNGAIFLRDAALGPEAYVI